VFTLGTLVASIMHRNLFAVEVADVLWFGFFVIMPILLCGICIDMFRSRGDDQQLLEKVFI
jgi:hypothetical protein